MRSVVLAFILFVTACAHSSGPRPINVHAVRMEIKHTIDKSPGESGERSIISMGRVTADSAVVYTDSPSKVRREESWVRGPSGWTLSASKSLAAAAR